MLTKQEISGITSIKWDKYNIDFVTMLTSVHRNNRSDQDVNTESVPDRAFFKLMIFALHMMQIMNKIHWNHMMKLNWVFCHIFKANLVITFWSNPVFLGTSVSMVVSKHYPEHTSEFSNVNVTWMSVFLHLL